MPEQSKTTKVLNEIKRQINRYYCGIVPVDDLFKIMDAAKTKIEAQENKDGCEQ